jgi:hypothetical protein
MSAQSEPENCASAASSVLANASPAALDELAGCPTSGLQALASLWARSGQPVPGLAETTMRLHDARLLEAVKNAAATTAMPTANRLAALQVLINYFNPDYVASIDYMLRTNIQTIPTRLGGAAPTQGGTPLPADVRIQVGRLLATISVSDPDASVRRVAHRVRQSLAYADPANTPITAGAITLVAGCGREVFLRSTADIDVNVTLRTADGSFAHVYGVRAGSPQKPGQLDLALPTGTIIAQYDGREVSRLSARNGHRVGRAKFAGESCKRACSAHGSASRSGRNRELLVRDVIRVGYCKSEPAPRRKESLPAPAS